MQIPCYQVDAFTSRRFEGNPACVIPLAPADRRPDWPDDTWLQNVARENNLSETAFLRQTDTADTGSYDLRWFTPATEVDLCGHATLASAHVLYDHIGVCAEELRFRTRSGTLTVRRRDNAYAMDFPASPPKSIDPDRNWNDAVHAEVAEGWTSQRDLMLVLHSEQDVRRAVPDFARLESLPQRAVIITAPGRDAEVDFVSRFFAPKMGVPEDPVTGSAHCMLLPYWSDRLGKTKLHARQLSLRSGELTGRYDAASDRVELIGSAVTYLQGTIHDDSDIAAD